METETGGRVYRREESREYAPLKTREGAEGERDGFAALRTNFRGPRGKNPLLEGILGSKRPAGVSFWSHYYLFWVKIEGIRHFRPENVLQRKRERPGRIMRSKVEIFARNG